MPDRIEEKKSGRHVGYWAAQEQYSMHDLLKFIVEAEKCGFSATMTSDHFHPWWHDNAFGNFTWVWIAAAAARTNRMRFITGVTAPIYRYHPAVIPRKLERKAKEKVPDETLNESIDIITSIEDSMKSIENYFKAGFTTVYVHSTSPDEVVFVRSFGKKILPYFTSR